MMTYEEKTPGFARRRDKKTLRSIPHREKALVSNRKKEKNELAHRPE